MKSQLIAFKVSREDIEHLDRLCNKANTSRSEIIRLALRMVEVDQPATPVRLKKRPELEAAMNE